MEEIDAESDGYTPNVLQYRLMRSWARLSVYLYKQLRHDLARSFFLPMALLRWITTASILFLTVQALNWTATPFNPASIPLAVRSPYVSGEVLNANRHVSDLV